MNALFSNPKDRRCKRIERLLHRQSLDFDVIDATAERISAYLYKDMRITKLPALYMFSNNKHRIYEGCREIENFLSKTA